MRIPTSLAIDGRAFLGQNRSDMMATTTEIIRQIEAARNSRVICFVTSERVGLSPGAQMMQQDCLRPLYDLARGIWSSAAKSLDLFIFTRGGDADVPWALMSMLREVVGKKELNALVPYRCLSAGTLCILGADQVVMGQKGELGPINTTMNTPYNPPHPKTGETLPISVEDVMGYFSLLDKVGCTGTDGKIEGLKEFTQKVNPYAIGMVQRLDDQTKLVASQMLARRHQPFSDAENDAIVATLAKRINSHRHAISRNEAIKQIGLTNIQAAEMIGIDSMMWDLFLGFERKLDMANPLVAEDEFWKDESLENREHQGVACCYVETAIASKVCKFDMRITRTREMFQSLTVSPQITLASPALPAGIDQAQVMQLLQVWMQTVAPQVVQQVVNDAVEKARKSAPTKGFQRVEYPTSVGG